MNGRHPLLMVQTLCLSNHLFIPPRPWCNLSMFSLTTFQHALLFCSKPTVNTLTVNYVCHIDTITMKEQLYSNLKMAILETNFWLPSAIFFNISAMDTNKNISNFATSINWAITYILISEHETVQEGKVGNRGSILHACLNYVVKTEKLTLTC